MATDPTKPDDKTAGRTLQGHATDETVAAPAPRAVNSPFQKTITAPPIADALTVASDSLLPSQTNKSRSSVGNEMRGASVDRFTPVDAGRFEILDELARGGLGRVFRARDPRTGRIVAVKEVLHPSPEIVQRFAREALVTANLQHPSIVPVYEVGRWPTGDPFYAMKLVEGRTLEALIRETRTQAERVALLPHVIAVAEALAYAHGEHVIHRDLKPANILVGAYGETIVIDWGLAKNLATDEEIAVLPTASTLPPDANETVAGSVLGTPAYMPPEQALGEKLDERADVYAIGAILYHTLAGKRPFAQAATLDELLELVAFKSPTPLAELAPELPPELVAIVQHAMARDPAHRYATAQGIAKDLRDFQAGKLVAAHHYTSWELVRRWVAQHKAVVATAAVALTVLIVVGAIGVTRIANERDEANRQRSDAQTQRGLAEQRFADSLQELARQALVAGDAPRALPLAAGAIGTRTDVPAALAVVAAQARAPYESLAAVFASPRFGVNAGMMPEDGTRFFTASGGDETVRAWTIATNTEAWSKTAGYLLALSPGGALVLVANTAGELLALDAATGAERQRWKIAGERIDLPSSLAWAPDRRHFAAASDTGKVWLGVIDGDVIAVEGHAKKVNALLFSRDGALLASSADQDDAVVLRDGATGATRARIEITTGGVWGIGWSDAQHVFIGDERYARLYNIATRKTEMTFDHGTWVYGFVNGGPADRRWIVTYGHGSTARLWDFATQTKIADLDGHNVAIQSALPVGDWLVTLDEFGTSFVWDPRTGERVLVIPRNTAINGITGLDDRVMLFGEQRQEIWRLPPATGALSGMRRIDAHTARIRDLVFEGNVAVWTGSNDGTVRRTPLDGSAPRVFGTAGYRENVRSFDDPDAKKPPYEHGVRSFDLSADGALIAVAREDGTLQLSDTATGAPRVAFVGHTGRVRSVVLTADGRTAFSVGDSTLRRWDVASGAQTGIVQLAAAGWDVALFADGTIATVTDAPQNLVELWTPDLAKKPFTFEPVFTRDLAIANDRLVVGTFSQIYVLDSNGKVLANAPQPKVFAVDLHASATGIRFLGGDPRGDIVLHAENGDAIRSWTASDGIVTAVAFSPDGQLVASISGNRVRVWDPETGALLAATAKLPVLPAQLAWSADGTRLAIAGSVGTIWIWDVRPSAARENLAAFSRCASPWQLVHASLDKVPLDPTACRVLAPSK